MLCKCENLMKEIRKFVELKGIARNASYILEALGTFKLGIMNGVGVRPVYEYLLVIADEIKRVQEILQLKRENIHPFKEFCDKKFKANRTSNINTNFENQRRPTNKKLKGENFQYRIRQSNTDSHCNKKENEYRENFKAGRVKNSRERCFNCGSFQHIRPLCPYIHDGPRCFICSSFGHLSSMCY